MIPRADAIAGARDAGYHNDAHELVRLICSSRASRATLDDAWRQGADARKAGMRCDCGRCKRAAA